MGLLVTLAACGDTADVPPPPVVDEKVTPTPTPDVPQTKSDPEPVVTTPPVPLPPSLPAAAAPFWETPLDDGPALPDIGEACLRTEPQATVPGLHVIAIYAPRREVFDERGRVPRPVAVHVTGTDPVTLVLSNYEPTIWNVTLAPGASVANVTVDAVYSGDTSVTGVPGVPVTIRATTKSVAGWTRASNDTSSPSFPAYIEQVRSTHGGHEVTFQGAGDAASFTVGSPAGAAVAPVGTGATRYDMRVACADACVVPAMPLTWKGLGAGLTTSADQRTVSFQDQTAAFFASSRGARCGKHYFEVETTAEARVGIAPILAIGPTPIRPDQATYEVVPAGSRVGVAFDLESLAVRFAIRTPQGSVIRSGSSDYALWYREEVGPSAMIRTDQKVTGGTRLLPPGEHFFVPPPGYVADF